MTPPSGGRYKAEGTQDDNPPSQKGEAVLFCQLAATPTPLPPTGGGAACGRHTVTTFQKLCSAEYYSPLNGLIKKGIVEVLLLLLWTFCCQQRAPPHPRDRCGPLETRIKTHGGLPLFALSVCPSRRRAAPITSRIKHTLPPPPLTMSGG